MVCKISLRTESGTKVVHKWYQSGTKVVHKWYQSGTKVFQNMSAILQNSLVHLNSKKSFWFRVGLHVRFSLDIHVEIDFG
jgi:hypothetical protein